MENNVNKNYILLRALSLVMIAVMLLSSFGLTAFAQETVSSENEVESLEKETPLLRMGIDNNAFPNSAEAFVSGTERLRYYTDAGYLNTLLKDKPESIALAIQEYCINGWGGSGYSMAAAMVLASTGRLDITQFETGKECFYKLYWPVSNLNFRVLINFYQLLQFSGDNVVHIYDESLGHGKKDLKNILKEIVSLAEDKEEPFIITFAWDNKTTRHSNAVVAVDYEKQKDGSHTITLINPEDRTKYQYLTIDKNFSSWTVDDEKTAMAQGYSIGYQTVDEIGLPAYVEKRATYENYVGKTVVILEQNAEVKITNGKDEELEYANGKFSGTMDFEFVRYLYNGVNFVGDFVILIDESEKYVVENMKSELDITIAGSNGVFCGVDGTNVQKITAEIGKFTVDGEEMAYSISALSNEENVEMINIRGGEPRTITFETDENIFVKSERKRNIRVGLMSEDAEFYECDYTPADRNYRLTSELVQNRIEYEQDNSKRVIYFFIGFAGVMAVSVVSIVVLIVKKKKKTKKEKNNEE